MKFIDEYLTIHGSILLNIILGYLLFIRHLPSCFMLTSMLVSNSLGLIVRINISPPLCRHSWLLMVHCINCHVTREQNVVAECKHRHIMDIAPSLLLFASFPRSFWYEVVPTVVHFINVTPYSVLSGATPHNQCFERREAY